MNFAEKVGLFQMARILLADDDDDIRDLIERWLVSGGNIVTSVRDGGEALALLKKASAYDLVITDIFMPGQDGLGIILFLRKEFPTMPVLAISGGSKTIQSDYLDSAKNLGASGILRKPFGKEDILMAVGEILSKSPPIEPA